MKYILYFWIVSNCFACRYVDENDNFVTHSHVLVMKKMGGQSQQQRRGRKKRSKVDRFQAIAWFNAVSLGAWEDSPFRLEKRFQPENIKKDEIGRQTATRAWDKYRSGDRLPKDGYKINGLPGPVIAAGMAVPDSLYIYRHPIWHVMRADKLSFEEVIKMLGFIAPFVSHNYLDLETSDSERQFEAFAESVGMPIWIDLEDDFDKSLDHLAIHLMILRMDNFRHTRERFGGIAKNIAKTLEPLSVSPWLGEIHEEFFDWLEVNVWGEIFNRHYDRGSQLVKGWRKTRSEWLLPQDGDYE